MKVLVTERLDPGAIARLTDAGHEVVERHGVQGDDLVRALEGCQGLIVRGATKVTAAVLSAAPDLRGVARAGTGLDNIDVETARGRGIDVVNAPAANAISVAELVFGLLLALERQLIPATSSLAAGRWEKSRFMGRELHGKTLGLVGFGRIGRDVAQRARAFGMRVHACDPVLSHWPVEFDWVAPRTLDALLRESDVITLHLPLTPESRGMIGERELSLMKPDAVLVNAARGGVVDEEALHRALTANKIRGAALDVFAQEPPGENPLLGLPNVIATPHLGAATFEAQARAGIEAAERLLEAIGRAKAGR
jgi:D-3-phosphoglycerate dehydrogenase